MGFFSWKTSDTKKSIANAYTKRCKPVYLLMPDGNHIYEPCYDGYGRFGGFDAYELLAKMNGKNSENPDRLRDIGIELAFGEEYETLPFTLKFSFDKNADYNKLPPAENCEFQGYFY